MKKSPDTFSGKEESRMVSVEKQSLVSVFPIINFFRGLISRVFGGRIMQSDADKKPANRLDISSLRDGDVIMDAGGDNCYVVDRGFLIFSHIKEKGRSGDFTVKRGSTKTLLDKISPDRYLRIGSEENLNTVLVRRLRKKK